MKQAEGTFWGAIIGYCLAVEDQWIEYPAGVFLVLFFVLSMFHLRVTGWATGAFVYEFLLPGLDTIIAATAIFLYYTEAHQFA